MTDADQADNLANETIVASAVTAVLLQHDAVDMVRFIEPNVIEIRLAFMRSAYRLTIGREE